MTTKTITITVLLVASFFLYRCNTPAGNTSTGDSTVTGASNTYGGYASQTEWGHHLVTVGGCGDCHTPKKMTDRGPADDSSLMFSGSPSQMPAPVLTATQLSQGMAATNGLTAWTGPWGNSYAANLTPDSTGIGAWTEDQFIRCIREGLYKGLANSRPIMPPMPIASYKEFYR